MTNYEKSATRNIRDGNWYWIDKNIIRQYTPIVGLLSIVVYNYLASMANAKQTCYPSQQHIADVFGYSRTSINKAIRRLEIHGLISVDKTSRYPQNYRLLRIRCAPDEQQVLNYCVLGVKYTHTTNIYNKNK